VPDRSVHGWKESNPKGYAHWFEERGAQQGVILERAAVEPLPPPEEAKDKNTLQLAVQLIKRNRDIRFAEAPELAPISIVLTTLAGMHYHGERSPIEALLAIVGRINASIPSSGRLVVCNPATPLEDLSERWNNDPKAYRAFVAAMRELEADLRELRAAVGYPAVTAKLTELFGEPAIIAVREQTEIAEKARHEGRLGVTRAGALTTAISSTVQPVRRNTFYGA
jgi:hypothetical protein